VGSGVRDGGSGVAVPVGVWVADTIGAGVPDGFTGVALIVAVGSVGLFVEVTNMVVGRVVSVPVEFG
jgi:hypothetical protein